MELNFDKLGGVVPVIVQDVQSGQVLMVGFMNEAAVEVSLISGQVTFYSRSRQQLWRKGQRSGHRLALRELRIDCNGDAVLARVELEGPGACHEGYRSCFFRRLLPGAQAVVADERVFDPEKIYGAQESS
jgi:phosphoribosyl-AMP cyclohydrolase